MSALAKELAEAEALVDQLRRRIASATCVQAGHDWKMIGGTNAGCDRDCVCSVLVNVCAKCGDCDYGDNLDAEEVHRQCAALEDQSR